MYIYFRIRYTLKTAKNPEDSSSHAAYAVSFYPIFALCIEVLCMAAMALYAGKLTALHPKSRCIRPATALLSAGTRLMSVFESESNEKCYMHAKFSLFLLCAFLDAVTT